ncbi:unnamed protein product, partial [Symbiodinium microadriaticum]
ELMSWNQLRGVLHSSDAASGEKALRADLGLCLLESDKAAFASLDTRLREAAGAAADNTPQVASTQSSALLAIHAVASKKWDDARRL